MSGSQLLLLGGNPQAVPVDPFFYSVTSLLHGDGTNGGQNNTFLDSSTNNFTITRNGNTTQGSFSPFSQTGWGNYFDGSSLLTFASSANYVPGSGEFCLECWFMPTSTGTDRWLIGNRNGNYVPFAIVYTGSTAPTALLFYMSSNGSTWDVINGGYAYGVVANQWNHLAFVRSGTSIIAYLNGVGTTLATSSANFSTAQPFYVGGSPAAIDPEFVGYISNVRFVKGSTPYSGSTITVPTTPLTAITNTQLLTSQSNRFLDNSTNAVTPSITGSPSVQPFSPFNPTTPYSTSSIGGSGYFDGSGDYLTAPNNSAFNLGTGNFTIEGWIYPTTAGTERALVAQFNAGGVGPGWTSYLKTTNVIEFYGGSGTITVTGTTAVKQNAWNHFAVVRNGSTITIYLDGVAGGTGTNSSFTDESTAALEIGARSSGGIPFTGYMSGLRIVKGTAVYTANFTPPTAPLTAIANTSLLTNFTNGAIFDNAAVADYETVGNAQISTSVKKYGTGSISLDGTGDYLLTDPPSAQLMAFGTGDFTVEMWVYFNAIGTDVYHFYDSRPASTDGAYPTLRTNASSQLEYVANSAVRITGLTLTTNTWYHVALCRTASQTKLFVNGTQTGSTYADTTNYVNAAARPLIGGSGFHVTTLSLNGYVDDVRISKGIARYPYNFTPPTAEFPNIGGTVTLTADPNFEYTTLLLPGNGTNGAQNNTFLDSSTNNFTITRNGNTTQGTFSPFSQTGWGNYFDGATATSLTMPSNTAFAFGTGAYTVEGWVYLPSYAAVQGTFFDAGNAAGAFDSFITNTGALGIGIYGTGTIFSSSASAVALNQWVHIAIVRTSTSSNSTVLYVNGTSVATGTDSNNWAVTTTPSIGGLNLASYSHVGYISNLRVVKGTAVYTTNFTPSTTPLTAITNTSLLTCQSNRFIDNSSNAFAITRNGDVSVQAFSPFNPTAAWSASTNGGSGYFDGSGDYLTVADNAAFAFGSGDFTIEFWLYNTGTNGFLVSQTDNATAPGSSFFVWITSGALSAAAYYGSTGASITAGSAFPLQQWVHVALVRATTTMTMYVNGASVGTAALSTNSLNDSSAAVAVGARNNGSDPITGYISGLRVVKGTAVYTTTFTPPTAPLTAITNTSLLLNYTNAGIYDATSKNDLETVGNAQISTTQSKFGGSSMYFDGTDDSLRFYEIINTQFGTGDFTVECWVYLSSLASNQVICDARGSIVSTQPWQFYVNTSGKVVFNYGSNLVGGISVSTATWTHIAAARYGSTLRIFVNGVFDSSATTSASLNGVSGQPAYIGRVYDSPGSPYFNGYIDDLRVTKGIARYTSNFTPPTTAFLTL